MLLPVLCSPTKKGTVPFSQAAGATYTTYLAEMIFGTYGNQLSNAALNWVTTNHNYHADE